MTTSRQGGKGAFEKRPELERRVAAKRLLAKLVLFLERLAPRMLLPLSIAALFVSLGWLGLFRQMPDILRWAIVFVLVFAFISTLLPLARVKWPTKDEASRLLEERNGLPHQPVGVQEDEPAFETPIARALWKEHQLRMAERIAALDAGLPKPDIARHDRMALRAVPALLIVAAFGFSFSNGAGGIADAFRNQPTGGPTNPEIRLDAWVTPPSYTGRAPIFLTGQNADSGEALSVPQSSKLTIRMSGGDGDEQVTFEPEETGQVQPLVAEGTNSAEGQPASSTQAAPEPRNLPLAPRTFTMDLTDSGTIQANGQQWVFNIVPDQPPVIAFDNLPRRAVNGALEIGFTAKDDYGVREAHAIIEPIGVAQGATPLYAPPEYKLDLPRQNPRDMKGVTSRNLTEHPMAGKRVRITLVATDGAGQTGRSPSQEMILPGRNFAEPLAASIVEQRQIFSLDTRQMPKAIAFNEAVGLRPEETIPNTTHYLLLQSAQTRMKLAYNEELLKQTADYLWEIALGIEDGELSQAERRLRDAQDALSDAMERKAPDEEIAKLMQELREAMNEFMRELAQRMQNAPQANMNQQAQNVLRQRDLENMMNQIENLARSGNREAAQEMLSQLQRMMNNLQAGRPQRGQQGQQQQENSQLRQQIDKLGEIMQQQQRLMDETFKLDQALRDRMQRGDPQQGQEGDQQMGENGQQQQNGQQQNGQGQNPDQMTAQQLREALRNLRQQQEGLGQQLGELQQGLRELGMEPGQNFGRAQQEMNGAGQALGQGQGEQAVEEQGNALNALRQGAQDMMGQIMQAMRQQGQQPGQGQQGMMGQGNQNGRDPLGRPRASNGPEFGDSQVRVPDEIDVQRAREILEAIREKLGNNPPGEIERRYLERLLDIQ